MSFSEPIDTLGDTDDADERDLGAFVNPDVTECPVVPLGFDGGKVIFAMPEGEIRSEPAARIGQMLRADIFACVAGQAFLAYWRDRKDKFHRELATVWFVRQCRAAGKWDTRRVQRGLGVWPGEPGEAVLHRGGEIQRWRATGAVQTLSIVEALRVATGPLYLLKPPAPSPAKKAASVDDGAWLRAHLDSWRFEALGDDGLSGADVLAGYIGLGLLGAVAPFRAHVLLAALPGSGKTTLLEFVHGLLSALAGEVINSFTDAGFRQEISGMARPVIVDEAEASSGENGPGPVEQVLAYLRLMTTGQGVNRKQVDAHGGGMGAQTAVGAVLMAAVLPPKLENALATRVAEIRMMRLDRPEDDDAPPRPRKTDAQLAEAAAAARELSPRLLTRALRGATRYREDLAAIKAALVDGGRSPRTADLVAALAAGRRLLLADEPLDAAGAAKEARAWAPLMDAREKTDTVTNAGADALAHLMSADSGLVRSGMRVPIGQLVKEETTVGERGRNRDILASLGLRIWNEAGPGGHDGPWLLVANKHPALTRIFGRTDWKDWRAALAYLDDVDPDWPTWAAKPLNFGLGVKSRSIAIPLTPWLDKPFRDVPGTRSGDDDGF